MIQLSPNADFENLMRRPSFRKLYFDPIEIPWASEFGVTGDAAQTAPPSRKDTWDLRDELLRWTDSGADAWTLEDAFRGTQIFGSTGGGKTTGAGQAIARAFLTHSFGGLVLCVKADEADTWVELCRQTGRLQDLRRITIDGVLRYNFLEAEAKSGGQMYTQNISDLFSEIISLVNRSPRTPQKDPFWTDVLVRVLNDAIVLQNASEGKITIPTLSRIITSAVPTSAGGSEAPTTLGIKKPEDPARIYLKNLYETSRKNRPNDPEVERAIDFFSGEFVKLAEKTRSIVVTTFTSMADSLLRRPLCSLLCEETTARPEEVFDGKIIVVDVPVHVYQRVGAVMNLIWKTAFKRACQRRRHISQSKRPVFLWADESHYYFDQVDSEFQTTARSSLCCTVLLTQNIQNYYAHISDRASVEALLGSLHNKIYHQNNESTTNQFASEAIGKVPIETKSVSVGPSGKKTVTTATNFDYDVPARNFTNLVNGGWRNRFRVDGIIHLPGRRFSNGKTWIKADFRQKP